eukprot:gene25138-biopygen4478
MNGHVPCILGLGLQECTYRQAFLRRHLWGQVLDIFFDVSHLEASVFVHRCLCTCRRTVTTTCFPWPREGGAVQTTTFPAEAGVPVHVLVAVPVLVGNDGEMRCRRGGNGKKPPTFPNHGLVVVRYGFRGSDSLLPHAGTRRCIDDYFWIKSQGAAWTSTFPPGQKIIRTPLAASGAAPGPARRQGSEGVTKADADRTRPTNEGTDTDRTRAPSLLPQEHQLDERLGPLEELLAERTRRARIPRKSSS